MPTFATMFGIGFEDLVRGGREIIQGGGDLGRLIFAAGSGASNWARCWMSSRPMPMRFSVRQAKAEFNEAVGHLKQYHSALKMQLPGQEWARHDRALKAARGRSRNGG